MSLLFSYRYLLRLISIAAPPSTAVTAIAVADIAPVLGGFVGFVGVGVGCSGVGVGSVEPSSNLAMKTLLSIRSWTSKLAIFSRSFHSLTVRRESMTIKRFLNSSSSLDRRSRRFNKVSANHLRAQLLSQIRRKNGRSKQRITNPATI